MPGAHVNVSRREPLHRDWNYQNRSAVLAAWARLLAITLQKREASPFFLYEDTSGSVPGFFMAYNRRYR